MNRDAVVEQIYFAVSEGNLAEIKKLVQANKRIEFKKSLLGDNWVHLAAEQKHWSVMEYFLELDVPINEATRHGNCALGIVAEQGNLEKTKWLIDQGATVKGNRTLIVNAIYGGNKEIVEMFLEKGAEYDFTYGADDRTPLSFAKMMGRDDIASLLESKGAKSSPVADDDPKDLQKRQEIIDCIRHHIEEEPVKKTLQQVLTGKVSVVIHSVQTDENVILFTSGMSFEPMNVEKGSEELRHVELLMYLPKDWPINPDKDSPQFWPYRWLQTIAHYPHENSTWLGGPVSTFNNEDPPKPLYKGSEFTSFMLAYGFGIPEFRADDGRTVHMITVTPIYPEEAKLAQQQGFMELGKRFEANQISAMALPGRLNVAAPNQENAAGR